MTKQTQTRGIIVALIPNEEYTTRRPAIADPHLTVVHLGKVDDEDFSEKALVGYWDTLLKIWGHRIKANVTAESVFDGGDDGWAMVDLINAPFLPEFYTVAAESAALHGIEVSKDYGLLPHITKRYVKGPTTVEVVHRKVFIPFSFDRVGLWVGGDHDWEVGLT